MSLSPVQSSSKCGSSDFSIERILSEDSRRQAENTQVPNWLCCTRYQPPRLPRAANACRARRSGRHARVPFTGAQAAALEAAYARAPYLAPPALRALAAALQLREDRIKIWFQNRRARERREKSGNIPPPHAVALPSSALQRHQLPQAAWALTQHGNRHIRENTTVSSSDYNSVIILNEDSLRRSLSTSEEELMESRCESPLDVETIYEDQ